MTRLRVAVLALAASLVLAVPLSVPAMGRNAVPQPGGTFVGIDGLTYQSTGQAVPGIGDEIFYGPIFDVVCGLGQHYERVMREFAKLAKVIEQSGRKVVFTVVPDKYLARPDLIDAGQLPHGYCDSAGRAAQSDLLDRFPDPAYLPLRKALSDPSRQLYWRTDLHWTTVGASVFAKSLADRLDPAVGRRQHYTYGTETRLGDLSIYLGSTAPETLETAVPRTHTRVRPKGPEKDWSYPAITFDHSWSSRPVRHTWPGRTLLLGDSFLWYALENLRPVFGHGRFLWSGHVDDSVVLSAIKRADTVVIEAYQFLLPFTPMLSPTFRSQVRKELR